MRPTPARLLPALLLLGIVALLAGCTSLDFLHGEMPAPAAAPRLLARYAFEVRAEAPLRELLLTHLDLARYQRSADTEALSPVELDRLAAAAPAQARALLETEGYFNPQLGLSRQASGDAAGESLRLDVEAGPRSRVAALAFAWDGALGAEEPAATALRARLQAAWRLREGEAFTQAAWRSAKAEALALARANGFALARWAETAARVQADQNRVELQLRMDGGPLFRLGAVRVEGLHWQSETTVQRLAGFAPGQIYTEQALLDFQERLQKTLLFDGVSVELANDAATAEAAPVLVRVKEGPRQQATAGIGYHANTGQRVTLEHLHRQPFGLPLRSQLKLDLGRDLRAAQLDLSSYPQEDMQRNLGSLKFEQDRSGDQVNTSLTGRLGRLRETTREERLLFAEALRSRETRPGQLVTAGAASLNAQWTWRRVDSVLLPTDGRTASLLVGLGRADNSVARSGLFGRAHLKLAWYRPVGQRWYASARMEAAKLRAAAAVGIPEPLLLRAGGDDSVRGYAYRSLGPSLNGNAVGGHVLWAGSIELARPLSATLPNFWGAGFVDAGQAATGWRDWRAAVGYGLGLRWRSPVGPLRLDLARGVQVQRWRLHFSVGIAL